MSDADDGLPAIRLVPAPPDEPRLSFTRGQRFPRAVAWFGFMSLWGHAWHLLASAIATEAIDPRDWMRPDSPEELTRRVAQALGAHGEGATLADALGGDVWLDFVADTGDDADVSEAVATLVASAYDTEDPRDPAQTLRLPRGRVLIFGGDTAYPVATVLQVQQRLVEPWNRALAEASDGERRVVLAIPGNHDWYGGLDGFARLFRRSAATASSDTTPRTMLDSLGQLGHSIRWIAAAATGTAVAKRPVLRLGGYASVLAASYWALRLAPRLDLWGADRQLRRVDDGQADYFARHRDDDRALALVISDPVFAFLQPNPPGQEILRSLNVDLLQHGPLILTGDSHHYCRLDLPPATHVIAGGGGAFLHPTPVVGRDHLDPAGEWPGPSVSRTLNLRVPIAVALGRAGLLVHWTFFVGYLLAYGLHVPDASSAVRGAVLSLVLGAISYVVAGARPGKRLRIAGLALVFGGAIGLMPLLLSSPLIALVSHGFVLPLESGWELVALLVATVAGAFVGGIYLMLLALFGLRHDAAGALSHPGYKHFVRLRVRRDGSAIDGWVVGKVDPLDPKDPVVLVDRFTWKNPQASR